MAKVREFMCGLIDCIGATLSLIGLVILIIFAALNGDAFDIVSFILYGSALFLTYLFSTLYLWLNIEKKGINFFRKFIHVLLYFLIATSYTIISLGPLRGPWGWSIFGVIWGISVIGIVFSSIWSQMPKAASIPLTISLACTTIIAIIPFIAVYDHSNLLYSLWYLIIAGLLYTAGLIINNIKCTKKFLKHLGNHEIFHILILLGNVFQYWFILNYITII